MSNNPTPADVRAAEEIVQHLKSRRGVSYDDDSATLDIAAIIAEKMAAEREGHAEANLRLSNATTFILTDRQARLQDAVNNALRDQISELQKLPQLPAGSVVFVPIAVVPEGSKSFFEDKNGGMSICELGDDPGNGFEIYKRLTVADDGTMRKDG